MGGQFYLTGSNFSRQLTKVNDDNYGGKVKPRRKANAPFEELPKLGAAGGQLISSYIPINCEILTEL